MKGGAAGVFSRSHIQSQTRLIPHYGKRSGRGLIVLGQQLGAERGTVVFPRREHAHVTPLANTASDHAIALEDDRLVAGPQ